MDQRWPFPELEQRTVLIGGPVDGDGVNAAAARLMALDGLGDGPITVLVNAAGGWLAEAASLLDIFDAVRAPLEVTAIGRAHGAAGVLVAGAPGRRLAGPRATLSLRIGAGDRTGSAGDLERYAAALASVQAQLVARLARRTGRSGPWLAEQLEHGGLLTADAARDAGLLDGLAVRPPRT